MSGISNDLREIELRQRLAIPRHGWPLRYCASRAQIHRSYAAVMGGLDAVIVTGGIGENSASMRQAFVAAV